MVVTAEKEALKTRLNEALDALQEVLPPMKRSDNLGPILGEIYVAQEAKKWADARLKKAWAIAQSEDGPVPSDNDMRAYGKGEHMVCESTSFSVVASVDAPRSNFDKEAFITQVAAKFKIPLGKLNLLAASCVAKSAPPLSKRVNTAPGV